MDFRQMYTFIEVADLKSFSKASEKLYMTQPTVTSQIQKLEQELKTSLFDRNGRGVTLTQTGEIFYKYAKEIINLKSFASYEMSQYKDKVGGTVGIGCVSFAQTYLLPKLIKEFLYLYSSVRFEISSGTSKNVLRDIENGYISFGIVDRVHSFPNLEYQELLCDPVMLVLPASFSKKIKNGHTLTFDELKDIPLIIGEDNYLEEYFEKKDGNSIKLELCDLTIVAQNANNTSVMNMIKSDIGASFLPKSAIEKELAKGNIIYAYIDELSLYRHFYFVHHKTRKQAVICKRFLDFIKDYYKK